MGAPAPILRIQDSHALHTEDAAMSTPHNDQGPGNNAQGWNPPGGASQDGRQAGQQYGQQYGQQDSSGPYGYQPAQPSSYAYPTSGNIADGSDAPGKGPAPKEVMRAYYLILAAGVAYLVSSITSALLIDMPEMAGGSFGVGIRLVFAVVFAAVYVVLALFIRRGQNWARITATVLAALNVVSTVGSLLLLPIINQAAEASGTVVPETPVISTALGLLVMLLGVAGVVMTYLKPARPYFAPQRLGY